MVEIVAPGGSGSGSPLTVSDGTTTVTNVTDIEFSGVTVTNGGGGIADVTITATGYQVATGTVNGSNKSFTFTVAPKVLGVDGTVVRKVASDGTVNWTGTTNITLSVAPNFDLFGIA